ncbi:EAL domain-containing protein [uncultured Alsobacter sp.]|uniref:putative bifunctional diguanylate cyclase/phosphodiesterase n=1 Tax=uncultured Alsobacter sp. TaxID=1748258 RepID=UPI0025FC2E84|nr:EAL domain-containing protein [uncultured Alsobacter sp.]
MSMRRLFARQVARATGPDGRVDIDALAGLVEAAYLEAENDRERTDRAISLMSDELQEANERLLDAFEVVSEGLVLLDAKGRYVLFNRKFLELYDTASDAIKIGASFAESVRIGVERGHYLEAVGREEAWLAERAARHLGHHSAFEQHLRGDRWVRVEERRTTSGGSIGIRVDITDLKRREEALKKRSEELLEAQRIGKIGDWSFHLGQKTVWWSPQIYNLLGMQQGEGDPSLEDALSRCGEDVTRRLFEAHSRIARSREIVSIDAQLLRGDGTYGDFVVTSKPILDAAERIVGFSGTVQDISERKSLERELETLAYFDPLTGLANRALFRKEVNDVLTRCARTGQKAALMLLDLDGFKEVNDSLGHSSGDELLCRVAQLISPMLGPHCFFARLGGDEFAIIMSDIVDEAAAEALAARIIARVSQPFLLERGDVAISTSIGIAVMPRDGGNLSDVQRNADLALYRAKDEGRARFEFFRPEMSSAVQHKLVLAKELRQAISRSLGLSARYQPQVDARSGMVTAFEGLLRWNHPTLGSIPPSEFIPIAESSQLICDLGLWILREAARQAVTWLDIGAPAGEVAINVSAAQIWHSDFPREVEAILAETGLPPNLLCLELTESLLADRTERRIRNVLADLKGLGVTLALDDFGTGYSSLGYLTQLPFDKLKIDKVFIDSIVTSPRARRLLEGILALGRGLNMKTVAEGAEHAEQVAVLLELGCDVIQGYAFAPPLEPEQALQFAAAHNLRAAAAQPGQHCFEFLASASARGRAAA